MKKFIQQKLKDQKGMTLIELLAVIVIIAIIAAIAIPAIGNIIENSRHNSAKADVQNVLSAGNLYFTDKGSPDTTVITKTDLADYVDDFGNLTSASITKTSGGNTITATVTTEQGVYDFTDVARDNATLSGMDADDVELLFTPAP